MLLSGGTPRPKARSAHEGISPAGAVYRMSSIRPRLQEARRLRRSFFSAVLGSLHGAFISRAPEGHLFVPIWKLAT